MLANKAIIASMPPHYISSLLQVRVLDLAFWEKGLQITSNTHKPFYFQVREYSSSEE